MDCEKGSNYLLVEVETRVVSGGQLIDTVIGLHLEMESVVPAIIILISR